MARPRLPMGTWGEIGLLEVDGRWRARVQFRDWDGRRKSVSAWGSTQAQAKHRLRTKLRDRQDAGDGPITRETTVSALVDLWLAEAARERKSDGAPARTPQTIDRYRDVAKLHIDRLLGDVRVGETTTGGLDRALQSIAEDFPTQAKHSRTVLSGAFSLAVRHDALHHNPADGTAKIRIARKSPLALPIRQIARLRTATRTWRRGEGVRGPRPSTVLPDAVDLMIATGVRIGEVLALRWGDVDLEAGKVSISGTIVTRRGEGTYRQPAPKTAAGFRRLVLPKFAVKVLERRRPEGVGADDYVFPTRTGRFVTPNQLRNQLRWALEAAGLQDEWIHPHALRRSVATLVARSAKHGIEDTTVQMGHSSEAISRAYYVEQLHDGPDVADLLDEWVRQADAEFTNGAG